MKRNKLIFDVSKDFLASEPTPKAIIAYRVPPALQAKADNLIQRNDEGQLAFDEQQELIYFMRVDEMMALLKAKSKVKLQK